MSCLSNKIKVAVFTTHPIQYQVPWFQKLALQGEIDLKVFFGFLPDPKQQGVGFDIPFQWDIPLLVAASFAEGVVPMAGELVSTDEVRT